MAQTNATRIILAAAGAMLASSGALAQLEVSPTNQWAWSENAGWLNWGDTASPNQVILTASYMGGFVWGENIGWINLGDGTPANGVAYANTSASDFGVNIDPGTGEMSGYAWAENVGWINFATTPFIGPDGARFDDVAVRLRGYAWGENIGWVNLDDASFFVGFTCNGDLNGDGTVDGADLGLLLGAWGGPGAADLNGSGSVDGADLGLLLGAWGPCL
jgi:hypothetical protein